VRNHNTNPTAHADCGDKPFLCHAPCPGTRPKDRLVTRRVPLPRIYGSQVIISRPHRAQVGNVALHDG
jgi:hypothetical protein